MQTLLCILCDYAKFAMNILHMVTFKCLKSLEHGTGRAPVDSDHTFKPP